MVRIVHGTKSPAILADEATHGRRNDKARRTGSGWRPSDSELADERILTNTPKSSEAASLYIIKSIFERV